MRTVATSMLLALVLSMAATWPSASPAESTELALPERRALAAYRKKVFPAQQKAIQAAAGFEVPVEVDWMAVALPGQGARFASRGYWTDIYFVPVVRALSEIAVDEMGREAVREKLKRIRFTYDPATAPVSAYGDGVSFDGSILTVNFAPGLNTSEIRSRADAIRKALEARL